MQRALSIPTFAGQSFVWQLEAHHKTFGKAWTEAAEKH
jgi:hypothetical protein